ncbi:MAG: RdgB/HAM1 family non-canonical purine NTP pyrophosphatase [Armatimonadetes bacterium]|nr:RdgB/HAM1 family non-canonical purine NTP pyrophosphatase [Armatimonadota bacterium]
MSDSTLVLATRNPHKAREIAALLSGLPVRLLTPDDFPGLPEVEETGRTFEENARLKAVALAQSTGEIALADDSGLVIDALDGAPGVYSNRFVSPGAAPEARNRHLLKLLENTPEAKRTARFIAVVAIAPPGADAYLCKGVCEGWIAPEMRGSGGFGYDPIFSLSEGSRTMAELSPEEKNALSHRGKALRAARPILESLFTATAGREI